MIAGIAILGIGEAFTIVPIIPEMMDAVEQQEKAHDKVSAIFNIAGGFGQIVAPLLSGWLTDKTGFNLSLDVWAIIVLSFLITYFVNCEGFSTMKRSFLKTWRREEGSSIPVQNSSVIDCSTA